MGMQRLRDDDNICHIFTFDSIGTGARKQYWRHFSFFISSVIVHLGIEMGSEADKW